MTNPYRDPPPRDETIRDRFAMAALTGLLGIVVLRKNETATQVKRRLSIVAYEYADAMLRARDR